ncbi:MAG: hypothetical protein ACKOLA_15490 [Spartobacteria bacterium]
MVEQYESTGVFTSLAAAIDHSGRKARLQLGLRHLHEDFNHGQDKDGFRVVNPFL